MLLWLIWLGLVMFMMLLIDGFVVCMSGFDGLLGVCDVYFWLVFFVFVFWGGSD